MSSKRVFGVLSVLIVLSMLISACAAPAVQEAVTEIQTVVVTAPPQVQTVVKEVEVVTEKIVEVTPQAPAGPKSVQLNFGAGDVPTLDPALATDTSSVQVAMMTFGGVTWQDEETNEVMPNLATEWTMSEDGLTYTFKLRDDVPWVEYDSTSGQVVKVADCEGNDRMVTAQDFQYGILRTLAPETASDYAYVLAFAIAGAGDYNSGVTTDTTTVGVNAVDATTLEIKFNEPAAFNTAIAGMWPAYAQPQWLIEGSDCNDPRGDKWTETGFFQGYGPFTLKEWVHDSSLTIIKNPFWPGNEGLPQAKLDEVTWSMLDEVPAFAEYEAGNMSATAVPLADIDRVKADPVLSAELKIAPQLCTYYYGFNNKAPVVDDARVRRALSMAIDRQSLIDNVTKGGQEPAQWFSRPGLNAAPTMATHPDTGVKSDAEGAKAELQKYLDEKGLTADQLDLTLMFNTSSGHQKIAEAIQQMWKENLGVDVKLANQEWAVYLKTIRDPQATPQIYRLGWCSDYADANNFIREVFVKGGSANPAEGGGVNYENPAFEEMVVAAAREQDPAKRVDMYAEAEELFVDTDAVIAPIYWYTRVTVTKPNIERTFGTGGQENLTKWDVK